MDWASKVERRSPITSSDESWGRAWHRQIARFLTARAPFDLPQPVPCSPRRPETQASRVWIGKSCRPQSHAPLTSVFRADHVDSVPTAARLPLPRGFSANSSLRRATAAAAAASMAPPPSLTASQGHSTRAVSAGKDTSSRKRGDRDFVKEEDDDGQVDARPRKSARRKGDASRECWTLRHVSTQPSSVESKRPADLFLLRLRRDLAALVISIHITFRQVASTRKRTLLTYHPAMTTSQAAEPISQVFLDGEQSRVFS